MTVHQEAQQPADAPEAEEKRATAQVVAEKAKQLVHEGNTRRIVVKDTRDRTVLDVPLNAGIVAVALAPVMTAAGAIAALAGPWSIEIERRDDPAPPEATG